MKTIKQFYQNDCGIACLAMYLRKSYEKVEQLVKDELNITNPIPGMSMIDLALIMNKNNHNPVLVRTMVNKVPAILTVPSLGRKKHFHYIYWDGKNIHDPSNFECYSNDDFEKLFPLAEAVCSLEDLRIENVKLPSHLISYFDWDYINDNR